MTHTAQLGPEWRAWGASVNERIEAQRASTQNLAEAIKLKLQGECQ